jgi:DNA adenine methylase
VIVPRRPVVRYHGGKWKLAPWLLTFFPAHRVYVEPFGGGASVLMRKPRSYAEVYNDRDAEIVNLFRVLRDAEQAAELQRVVRLTPFARDEFVVSYEAAADPVEQARRTIARSFMGFGSNAHIRATGFRANSNRSGTTPAKDWGNYSPNIAAFCERMAGVVVENRDAADVIVQHDGVASLHYADPPYPRSVRDKGIDYAHEMTDDDHRRLAEVLHGVRGMVVLSGYPCDLYDRELYPTWERHERAHLADGARKRTEVVWLNPACSAALARERSQLTLGTATA